MVRWAGGMVVGLGGKVVGKLGNKANLRSFWTLTLCVAKITTVKGNTIRNEEDLLQNKE